MLTYFDSYNLYGVNKDMDAVFGDVPRFIRWRVGLMERGVSGVDFVSVDSMLQIHGEEFQRDPLGSGKLTWNLDYDGVGLSSQTSNSKAAAGEASKIFQDYYPELLVCHSSITVDRFPTDFFQFKKYFINVPAYMSWMFWLFKPLLPAKTSAKLSMIGRDIGSIKGTLLGLIDASELPKRYGGEAEGF